MKLIRDYSFRPCNKCDNGYLERENKYGEVVLVPCDCKKEYDYDFLFNKIKKDSLLSEISIGTHNYDNPDGWFKYIVRDDINYEKIYESFFKNYPTKLIRPYKFFEWLFSKDLYKSNVNVTVFNFRLHDGLSPSDYDRKMLVYNFILNYSVYSVATRLIPTKILTFTEVSSKLMDKDFKNYLNELIDDYPIIFLPGFISKSVLDSLDNKFKFDRLMLFIHTLLSSDSSVVIFSENTFLDVKLWMDNASDKVNLNQGGIYKLKKYFTAIMNKSNTVLLKPDEESLLE